ncbi:hypothetical protein [Siminovitchia terrae]|uniref:hypothetical protein n=1 Tax=Siminovitchia terrae TaxID=1914933 RepID=UPI0028A7EE92|nr:hypothetical protein [Siminovitchia terrae]
MHRIANIVFFPDVIKLPKEILKEVCTDLMLDTSGTSYDLAQRLWDRINTENREGLRTSENRLLAGKSSVSWFKINEGALRGFKDLLQQSQSNPFETIEYIQASDLTSEPILIAAAEGNNDNEIYLRYAYNSGNRRSVSGTEVNIVPKSEITTVYIDTERDIIEVRTDARNAIKIASSIATIIGQNITLEQTRILAPFGNNVEQIANALSGELIDATSTPEFVFEDFNQQQTAAIINILNALNDFFDDENEEDLIENLKNASETFGEHLLTAPFTALILNGMERVGLRVNEGDLRGQPLYDTLRPYLQHQGGFIKFNRPINGVEKPFTVRVGLTTDSIFFTTPATEEVIRFVREQIIY